jgi:hypothetical protein
VFWRDNTGNTMIWLLNGAQIVGDPSFGVIPTAYSVALIGDFDGDGTSDIMWQYQGNNSYSIWFMNNGWVTSEVVVGYVSQAWSIQSAAAE